MPTAYYSLPLDDQRYIKRINAYHTAAFVLTGLIAAGCFLKADAHEDAITGAINNKYSTAAKETYVRTHRHDHLAACTTAQNPEDCIRSKTSADFEASANQRIESHKDNHQVWAYLFTFLAGLSLSLGMGRLQNHFLLKQLGLGN